MKTLKDVKIGDTAKVVKLHGEGPVKRRIMDMGITKGVEGLCAQGGSPGRPHGGDRAGLRAEPAQGRHRDDRGGMTSGGKSLIFCQKACSLRGIFSTHMLRRKMISNFCRGS